MPNHGICKCDSNVPWFGTFTQSRKLIDGTLICVNCQPLVSNHDMDTFKQQRQQLAKAILELHNLYISTGEEKKPMTISLPDMADMAGLPEDITENILILFIGEKLIHTENGAFLIKNKIALIGIAYNKTYIMSLLFYVRRYFFHSF